MSRDNKNYLINGEVEANRLAVGINIETILEYKWKHANEIQIFRSTLK